MAKIAEYKISRNKACVLALVVGVAIGVFNVFFEPIEFHMSIMFFLWVVAAIVTIVFLHEGVHGLVAVLCGSKPIFGLKPPLVYVTFKERVARGKFMLIALAPLVVLDIIFGVLFAYKILPVFSYFMVAINTIGAIGDVWIVTKLLPQKRGTWIQDTKSGVEVWEEAGEGVED